MNSNDAFLDTIRMAVKGQVRAMCDEANMLPLGELASMLAAVPPDLPVEFSDGTKPGEFCSYRGYYDHLALEVGGGCTAGELAKAARAAIGATFTGYKGGEFTMGRSTPVWWTDCYSNCPGIGIVGMAVEADRVVLALAGVDD